MFEQRNKTMDVCDSLQNIQVDNWSDLQTEFKQDWLRGITGFYALETQKRWLMEGIDYGFKVYCPYGEVDSGMISILCARENYYEMLIECPRDNTTKLQETLKKTKRIEWKREIVILFVSEHVLQCLKTVVDEIGVKIEHIDPLILYVLEKNTYLFDVSLPPGLTFQLLSPKHTELCNSKWPHRYAGSTWYFNLLIEAKSGFGLFKNGELISWLFVKEIGALGNLFTIEHHRNKGYGSLIMKLVCNERLKSGKDVHSFCLQGNLQSCNLHEKLGFKGVEGVVSCHLKPK